MSTLNRIYQGRAVSVELLAANPDDESVSFQREQIETEAGSPLWCHHEIFQDAVNYYLVALASLTDTDSEQATRLMRDLRQRIEAGWEHFPRPVGTGKPARSLRDSLRTWLGLRDDASLEDAFAKVIDGHTGQAHNLTLALVLDRCGGEAAIQQGGRGYFPRLCDANYSGGWDFDAVTEAATRGKARLSRVLHSNPDLEQLRVLADEMELGWSGVKLDPVKRLSGDALRERLHAAVEHQLKRIDDDQSARFAAALEGVEAPRAILEALHQQIDALADELELPTNRSKVSWDLLYSAYLFHLFPSQLTGRLLSLSIKKPSATSKKKTEEQETTNFSCLGDDPIKLARGKRGYVFRAFTALPAWNPQAAGLPAWKDFDIAAFKEALKSLNQFNQKTQERAQALSLLETERAIALGELDPDEAPGVIEDVAEGEPRRFIPLLAGDPRFEAAQDLEGHLSTMIGEGDWTIRKAALRGLRDIVIEFRRLQQQHGEALEPEHLNAAVKRIQSENQSRRNIGSVPLFLALAEPRFWCLWQEPSAEEEHQRQKEGRPQDMLRAMADFHDLETRIERAGEPINLTPAEPRHSRRLCMLSDFTGRSKTVIEGNTALVSLAVHHENLISEHRARITFTAPRRRRDHLSGSGEAIWLQPMAEALDLPAPEPQAKPPALALMPDFDQHGQLRMLLNLPIELDASWIHEGLGRTGLWVNPCNGTRDQNLHLHWPGTATTAAQNKDPWWQKPELIEHGFTTLSVDLGQRTAGAWALLRVTTWDPRQKGKGTSRPVRCLGHDGTHSWYAEVLKTGLLRLPGEDRKVVRNDCPGKFSREFSGKRGHKPDSREQVECDLLADQLAPARSRALPDETGDPNASFNPDRTFPEQNDDLIRLASRRLSRLSTYHRWSCFRRDEDSPDQLWSKRLQALRDELETYVDPEVVAWRNHLEAGDVEAFRHEAAAGFLALRKQLAEPLCRLADRIAPVRHQRWHWTVVNPATDGRSETAHGYLVPEPDEELTTDRRRFRGQRGLSMARLQQLENLRRLFLRFNRAHDREPGQTAAFGFADRNRTSGEPCPDLLAKLDRLKSQRINLTAHEIVAQALGVRLRASHRHHRSERTERDIHGEYELIPDRSPVDIIVLEDLSRYLTSQDRAPFENSRLMQWSHRAVLAKVRELACEPFGITLIETAAAYSSSFHAVSGAVGFRADEHGQLSSFQIDRLEKLARRPDRPDSATGATTLLEQFRELEAVNGDRRTRGLPPLTLLLPRRGGSLFVGAKALNPPVPVRSENKSNLSRKPAPVDAPVQADQNAAINLGLRALAAPGALDIHLRIRCLREGEADKRHFRPRASKDHDKANKREQAAFSSDDQIEFIDEPSAKLAASPYPNFFWDGHRLSPKDQACLKSTPVTSQAALWETCRRLEHLRCAEINQLRLDNWNNDDPANQIPMG